MPLRVKNVEQGFRDAQGRFHPIRASEDYDPLRAGDNLSKELKQKMKKAAKPRKKAAKKKTVAKGKAKLARRKRNPLPVDRYIKARVKRTRSGDIKIMIG